jgi:hypothetical protein
MSFDLASECFDRFHFAIHDQELPGFCVGMVHRSARRGHPQQTAHTVAPDAHLRRASSFTD